MDVPDAAGDDHGYVRDTNNREDSENDSCIYIRVTKSG